MEDQQPIDSQQFDDVIWKPLTSDDRSRVVIILHGSDEDPVFCHLEPLPVVDAPPYNALSYAWGNRNKNMEITVNGRPHLVTESLHSALIQLRHPADDLTFWIDVLCINQDEAEEKNIQVQNMASIYEGAHEVIAWLGPVCFCSDEAMDLARYIGSQVHDDVACISGSCIVFDTDKLGSIIALAHLTGRSWFRRRWVVQEIAFAKSVTVRCGASAVRWEEMEPAVKFLWCHRSDTHWSWKRPSIWSSCAHVKAPDVSAHAAYQLVSVKASVCDRMGPSESSQRSKNIHELLCMLSGLNVSEPRDTIYAIRSLAKDLIDSDVLMPSYDSEVPDICKDLVEHVISQSRSLDVICLPWAPWGGSLPSWIPRRQWAPVGGSSFYPGYYRYAPAAQSFAGNGETVIFHASKDEGAYAEFRRVDTTAFTLRSKMLHIDNIATLSKARTNSPDDVPRNASRHCWQPIADFWREHREPTWEQVQERLVFGIGRREVGTVLGRTGYVPYKASVGDFICILMGCSVPVILRPIAPSIDAATGNMSIQTTTDRETLGSENTVETAMYTLGMPVDDSGQLQPLPDTQFKLIGEAYVHGCMEGEALEHFDSARGEPNWTLVELV